MRDSLRRSDDNFQTWLLRQEARGDSVGEIAKRLVDLEEQGKQQTQLDFVDALVNLLDQERSTMTEAWTEFKTGKKRSITHHQLIVAENAIWKCAEFFIRTRLFCANTYGNNDETAVLARRICLDLEVVHASIKIHAQEDGVNLRSLTHGLESIPFADMLRNPETKSRLGLEVKNRGLEMADVYLFYWDVYPPDHSIIDTLKMAINATRKLENCLEKSKAAKEVLKAWDEEIPGPALPISKIAGEK